MRRLALLLLLLPGLACREPALVHAEDIPPPAPEDAGLEPPGCTTTAACRLAYFDAVVGDCVEQPQPDGTACADTCLEEASCTAGQCLGVARTCDDGDACTVDSCDPASGCRHDALTCPEGENRCHRATCSPATGCGFDLAPDGTACGPADCDTAEVCLNGTCAVAQVPEGTLCPSDSPCQGPGRCRDHACVLPPPAPLVPVWTYAPAKGYLRFTGISDSQGALYWTEGVPDGGQELVSVTRDGAVRYRQPLQTTSDTNGQLLSGSLLVIDSIGPKVAQPLGFLAAHRISDGAQVWSRQLYPDFFSAQDLPGGSAAGAVIQPNELADDGQGRLYLAVTLSSFSTAPPRFFLVSFEAATGALQWKREANGSLFGPLADTAGNAYVGIASPNAPFPIVSFDPGGVERWRSTPGYDYQFGIVGDWLVSAGRRLDVATGLATPFPSFAYSTVGSPTALYRSAVTYSTAYTFERRDAVSGTLDWTTQGAGGLTSPLEASILTDRGSVIGAGHTDPGTVAVVEMLPDAGVGFRCPLPATVSQSHWYDGRSMSLAAERLVIAEAQPAKLSAFELARTPGPQGWVCSAGGTPGRQNRPR